MTTALTKASKKAAPSTKPKNLYEAHNQWRDRPDDERFWTIDEMRDRCHKADQARRVLDDVKIKSIGVDASMRLRIGDVTAPMTNWAFRQVCNRAEVPAHFLATIPTDKAADLLDWSIKNRIADTSLSRISVAGGSVEAFTSSRYAYIPNYKICDGLRVLEGLGWRVPPARPVSENSAGAKKATQKDVLKKNGKSGLTVKIGDWIAPAGLYASAKDMFAFLVNENALVDDGANNGLKRGIFVSNSEVGAAAFKITCFLYDTVCGNHIVWGATKAVSASIRHLGDEAGNRAFGALEGDLSAWAEADGGELTKSIRAARRTIIGDTAEEIADSLVLHKRLYIGKADAIKAYELCEKLDGDRVNPRSVWGMVTGYTRLSQAEPCADRRVYLEEGAGRLMQLASN